MPNWTINKLFVKGPPDKLAELRERARGTDEDGVEQELMFSALLPEPDQSLLGRAAPDSPIEREAVTGGGRQLWRIVKWGTKWEADRVTVEEEDDSLTYEFLTAWNSPFPWLMTVSGMFPELEFSLEYQDEGTDEDYEDIYLRCVFANKAVVEADAQAIGDIRGTYVTPIFGDPWAFYFFSHPEEFVNAPTLMEGDPPEEIREWIENQLIQEAVAEKLRATNPVQMRRPDEGDTGTD